MAELFTASVIIVNYNAREYLEKCLSSLFTEEKDNYEIILVDNASTDGSVEFVQRVFPTVKVIRSQTNRGFGWASNVGAKQARGKYLVFLNPDTVVERGWFRALIDALEKTPGAGLATSKILLLSNPKRINTCGNEVHFTGLTLCRGLGREREAFAEQTEVGAVSGAAFVIRRDVFEALGGFDEDFFLYMEDTDLSIRARLAGYRCIYIPQSVVYHDYALRFDSQKTFYQERNRYMMLLKNLKWRTLLVLLPALLLSEVITWGFVLLRERRHLLNKLQAYLWIARHWREIMEKRHRVQALRRIRDRDLLTTFSHRLAFEQTGDDFIARMAHVVFDPLFFVLYRLALLIIRW